MMKAEEMDKRVGENPNLKVLSLNKTRNDSEIPDRRETKGERPGFTMARVDRVDRVQHHNVLILRENRGKEEENRRPPPPPT